MKGLTSAYRIDRDVNQRCLLCLGLIVLAATVVCSSPGRCSAGAAPAAAEVAVIARADIYAASLDKKHFADYVAREQDVVSGLELYVYYINVNNSRGFSAIHDVDIVLDFGMPVLVCESVGTFRCGAVSLPDYPTGGIPMIMAVEDCSPSVHLRIEELGAQGMAGVRLLTGRKKSFAVFPEDAEVRVRGVYRDNDNVLHTFEYCLPVKDVNK